MPRNGTFTPQNFTYTPLKRGRYKCNQTDVKTKHPRKDRHSETSRLLNNKKIETSNTGKNKPKAFASLDESSEIIKEGLHKKESLSESIRRTLSKRRKNIFAILLILILIILSSCKTSGPEFQKKLLLLGTDTVTIEYAERSFNPSTLLVTVSGNSYYTIFFNRDGVPMSGNDYEFYKIPPMIQISDESPREEGARYPLPNGLPNNFLITVEGGGKSEKVVLQ